MCFLSCCFLLLTLRIFECAAVRKDDTLRILVELDNLEIQFLAKLCLAAIFLNQVFRSSETFYVSIKCDNGTLIEHLCYLTCVDRTYCIFSFEYIPRIIFKLLVTKTQTTVLFVYLKYNNIDVSTYLCEF